MKQIIVAFVLLNIVIGVMFGVGASHPIHGWSQWLALELAQVLGAAQAVLYWSMWRKP